MLDTEKTKEDLLAELNSLRESELRYRTFVDNSPSGVWETNTDGVTLFCNPMLAFMFGISEQEMIGKSYLEFVFEEDLQRAQEIFFSLIQGNLKKFEFRFKRKDGEPIWTELSIMQLLKSDQISGAFAIVSDINHRKQVEDALRESERRYQTIFTAVNDGIWDWHVPSGSAYFSPLHYGLLGYDDQEFTASYANWRQRVHPDDIDRVEHDLRTAFENGQGFSIDLRMQTRGSDWKWVQTRGKTMEKDAAGKALRMVGTLSDITERKQNERALQKSEEFNRKIIQATPDCIKILDDDENVVYFSDSGLQLLKLESPENIIGKKYLEFWTGSDQKECMTAINIARRGKTGRFTGYCPDSDGQPMWWDVIITSLSGSNSRRFFVISRDITQRIQSEVELRQARDSAELANKSKSEFLANMSHEIRTPINSVLGMLQLIQTEVQEKELKEYVDIALKSSKRLSLLLSDILDFSRIEAGKMPIVEEKFEISELKDSIVELLGSTAKNKGIELNISIDNNILGVLVGDAGKVRQVLFNVVGNAIKFTDHGQVNVNICTLSNVRDERYHVLFIVTDTGKGIPDDQLERIFTPFIQGENSYVRQYQGAGLGLSIVKRLAILLNGSVSVESNIGEGTSIYISLPFKNTYEQNPEKGQHKSPRRTSTSSNVRILFAEDDSVTRIATKKLLEKEGYQVSLAVDGRDALKMLTESDFDLILMDIQMPEMDGVEATSAIRFSSKYESKSDIPIIAMTAYAMAGDKEKFLAAGMNDYISKPVDMVALVGLIEGVMAPRMAL